MVLFNAQQAAILLFLTKKLFKEIQMKNLAYGNAISI